MATSKKRAAPTPALTAVVAPAEPAVAAPALAVAKPETAAKPKAAPATLPAVNATAAKADVKKSIVKKAVLKKSVLKKEPVKALLTKAVTTKKPAKAAPAPILKAKKPKLVRDSFTIPKDEYVVLDDLKQRAAKLTRPAKKSELLRAAIKTLAALSDAAFLTALAQVPALKTGRPTLKK
jgi:hypothetical protein